MLPNKRVETPRQVESPAKMEGSSKGVTEMIEIVVHYGACNEGWNESFHSIEKAVEFARDVAPEHEWCWIDFHGGFEGLLRLPGYHVCEASKTGGKWYIGEAPATEVDAKAFLEEYIAIGQAREKRVREVIEEAKKDLPNTGDPLYDAFFNLPEIDIPLTEDEARMQGKIRALCKEMEANK